MPSLDACRTEIEALHDFFVDWYAGELERADFSRLEEALAPEFEMVTPDGSVQERETVLGWIHSSYGRDEPGVFSIEIRNLRRRADLDTAALIRYEEWQERPEETTGRESTVLLEADADAPTGLAWVDLHETWIES